jgi:hypothetical protein
VGMTMQELTERQAVAQLAYRRSVKEYRAAYAELRALDVLISQMLRHAIAGQSSAQHKMMKG